MKKNRKITNEIKVLAVIIVVTLILNWRVATGIILGYAFSFIYGKLLEKRFALMFENLETSKSNVVIGTIISFLLLATPLLIAFLLPGLFNFLGVAFGLLYRKYFLYLEAFRKKG